MYTDDLGRRTFSSKDLIKEIYRGNLEKIDSAHVFIDDEDYAKYIKYLTDNALIDWPIPLPEDRLSPDIESFDKARQDNWIMPGEYEDLDIQSYLLGLCKTEEQISRVKLELALFEQHNMMKLLCFLKYMVDKLRENTILWGVGRGSSVASYCLFLLGIHKIDSIKYDLDIREFLK